MTTLTASDAATRTCNFSYAQVEPDRLKFI